MSVEHRFVSKLPRVRKGVEIVHRATKDANFIIPDSREGWCELTRRVLESFFETGKGFTYSTVCVRGAGEPIVGFGGTASGPQPLVSFVEKLASILRAREGRNIRPIDASDMLCSIAEMVVAGNVRRSALIILGDPWDKEYLKAKRWDLGAIPTQRSNANFSVVIDDVDDLHPLFWQTYEQGEPFGLVNRSNIQRFARMGERKKDTAMGVNPCAEATLEAHEPCNLQEIPLPNLASVEEFEEVARLMHRYGKRVTMAHYHHPEIQEVIDRNRRVGTGITGCLEAPQFFNPAVLDRVYAAIQQENVSYSKEKGINESIRTTVIKPSGTMSKVFDVRGEGVHCGFSRYMIQRVRFAATDPLIPKLRAAGHHIEPSIRFDGTLDHGTLVCDFYLETPASLPCADEGFDTWQQLDTLLMAQKHWADQAVSVTVYYRKEEIAQIKAWLALHLKKLKTISFLCHNDHGFKQAPKEAITAEQYEQLSSKVKPIDVNDVGDGQDLDSLECAGGACPIK
jgi:ribonucleotide reductase alpha subunit